MNSGYNIPTVTSLCEINQSVISESRSEQVEELSSITKADLTKARAFYGKNHVTRGMSEFLGGALKRLSGKSNQAVFELRQAMGGGKTHNMIALGLLARFPELKEMLPADITDGMGDEPAVIATLNGRDVETGIWGDIAGQIAKPDELKDTPVTGVKKVIEGDWMRIIGDKPTLIMLDEMPTYLAPLNAEEVGKGTKLDIETFTLANLFSAAMKCKRCVVVVASLDASYVAAGKVLGGMLADIKSEINRSAMSITPVDLSTGEVYDILRKRMFTKLPEAGGAEIDQVAQAFLATYMEGVKGKALAKSAEQMADEIVDSYPFHPSYKDILSLFKENEKFQQTRGLIRFTANLIRGVWEKPDDEVFLLGAQHLDFSQQETREQVRKIERSLESALASDVYHTKGSSHAQVIDGNRGDRAASQVATILFISSLSENVDGVKGLRLGNMTEFLVSPGREPTLFTEAFETLKDRCWYLHNRDGDRWYFSDVANVRKLINDKVSRVPQDEVDRELRRRLEEIFRPVTKVAYFELAVLPLIKDVNLTPSKRTCLVLSPDAKSPPEAAARFFKNEQYKNSFCVVTGDGTKMASAEDCVRRLIAISAVMTNVDDARHQKEIEAEQKTAEKDFIATVKSLFNTVWYPQMDKLTSTRIDLGHYQEMGNILGERAVEEALSDTGARKLDELNQENMDSYIERCEAQLFPERQSRSKWSDVLARAASNSRWIWLPPKGMEEIKTNALDNERWVEDGDYVDKNPPPPKPCIRVTSNRGGDYEGESEIQLVVSTAGKSPEVRVAATRDGLEDGDIFTGDVFRTKEVEHWFQVRNTESDELSEPCQWKGTISITHDPVNNAGNWLVTLASMPEAKLRWNISGINPKDGKVYDGKSFEVDGQKKTKLVVFAKKGDVSTIREFTLDAVDAKKTIDDSRPAIVRQDFQFASKHKASQALRAAKSDEGIVLHRISVTVGTGDRSVSVRCGDGVSLTGQGMETMIDGLRAALGDMDADVLLRFRGADFPNGFTMRDFVKHTGIDISPDDVEQPD